MVGYRVYAIALFLFSLLVSPMSFAKSVSLKTITVNTPTNYGTIYAQIHYDERDEVVALKVKKIIETDLIKVVNYFNYAPQNTVHFNVDPYMRLTNGNATPFPTNIINLYTFPASNSEHLIVFDDWLRGLVFHEFTHITHLDQTRGVVEVGRRIFGNIAKILPGVVPHWFTEGIAVWSESHLMNSDGRLENPLFKKELLVQFLRQEYCTTIDCLDEPGVYPNRQLAYWAGAQFMEYIENKKPGSIKCMVEQNSSNFPFVLNSVFNTCTGNTAQNNFDNFREDLINNQPKITPESEAWGVKISNAFGSDDLQKGVILDGDILYKVEQDRKREALVSYDLQENVNMLITKFRYPISDLVGITTMPGLDSEAKYLIVAFNEDPFFRGDNRTWKLINTETLLLEATLPLKNDPSYVVGLGNNRFLTASFIDNKWRIEKQRVDIEAQTSDVELVKQFPDAVNLTFFKKSGNHLFLKLHSNEGDETSLLVSDLTLENLNSIYSSKNYYDIPVLTEKFLVIREKDQKTLFELSDDLKKFSTSLVAPEKLNRVTSVEISDSRALVLENRLKTKEISLKTVLELLKKDAKQQVSGAAVVKTYPDTPAATADNLSVESFPKLAHMRPYYWFLASGSTDNLFSIGAMTTFSDPMNINVINATVLSYPEEHKIGGNLDFIHKFTSVSDLWNVNGFFNQEYSKTDFSNVVNETTEGTLGTNYAILLKRWTLVPGLYVGATRTTDFISDRDTHNVGVNLAARYQAMHFDDYFQNLTFKLKVQDDMPDRGEDFVELQSKISAEGRFYERLVGGVLSSYGKLFKTGFSQGVLYGGGTATSGINRWHEFYGLPYSNAYGNEIFTLRLYLDYNFWYIYRGVGFFPVYLKEAHLLLGRETMTADRIILSDRLYRDKTIHSFFVGPRLNMNVFYYLPLDVDFIFSSIKRPDSGSSNQFEVTFNLEF